MTIRRRVHARAFAALVGASTLVASALVPTTAQAQDDTFRADVGSIITASLNSETGICGEPQQTEFYKNTLNANGTWSTEHIGCLKQIIAGLTYRPKDGYLYAATTEMNSQFGTPEIENYRFIKLSKGSDGKVLTTDLGEAAWGAPVIGGAIAPDGSYVYTHYSNQMVKFRDPYSPKPWDSLVRAPELIGRFGGALEAMHYNGATLRGIRDGALVDAVIDPPTTSVEFTTTPLTGSQLVNDAYIAPDTSGERFVSGFPLNTTVSVFMKRGEVNPNQNGEMWQIARDGVLITTYRTPEHLNSAHAVLIGEIPTTFTDPFVHATTTEDAPLADKNAYLGNERVAHDLVATNTGPVIASAWDASFTINTNDRFYADGTPIEYTGDWQLTQVFETDTDKPVTDPETTAPSAVAPLTTQTARSSCTLTPDATGTSASLTCSGKHLVPGAAAKARAITTVADPCPARVAEWDPQFSAVAGQVIQGQTAEMTLPTVTAGAYPAPTATTFQLDPATAPAWATLNGNTLTVAPPADLAPGVYDVPIQTSFAPLGCSSSFTAKVTVDPVPAPADPPATPTPKAKPSKLPKTGVADATTVLLAAAAAATAAGVARRRR